MSDAIADENERRGTADPHHVIMRVDDGREQLIADENEKPVYDIKRIDDEQLVAAVADEVMRRLGVGPRFREYLDGVEAAIDALMADMRRDRAQTQQQMQRFHLEVGKALHREDLQALDRRLAYLESIVGISQSLGRAPWTEPR